MFHATSGRTFSNVTSEVAASLSIERMASESLAGVDDIRPAWLRALIGLLLIYSASTKDPVHTFVQNRPTAPSTVGVRTQNPLH